MPNFKVGRHEPFTAFTLGSHLGPANGIIIPTVVIHLVILPQSSPNVR